MADGDRAACRVSRFTCIIESSLSHGALKGARLRSVWKRDPRTLDSLERERDYRFFDVKLEKNKLWASHTHRHPQHARSHLARTAELPEHTRTRARIPFGAAHVQHTCGSAESSRGRVHLPEPDQVQAQVQTATRSQLTRRRRRPASPRCECCAGPDRDLRRLPARGEGWG